MGIKVKKLDRRMNGYGQFIYAANFPSFVDADRFSQVRQWCWEQWGPSVELEIWQRYPDFKNPKWAWERGEFNKSYRCRIFLSSDQEAEWFILRWS
jgi:hypothetical protein